VVDGRQLHPLHAAEDGKVGHLRDRPGPEDPDPHRVLYRAHGAAGRKRARKGADGEGSAQVPPTARLAYCTSLMSTKRASVTSCRDGTRGTLTPAVRLSPGETVSSRSSTKVSSMRSPRPLRRWRLS